MKMTVLNLKVSLISLWLIDISSTFTLVKHSNSNDTKDAPNYNQIRPDNVKLSKTFGLLLLRNFSKMHNHPYKKIRKKSVENFDSPKQFSFNLQKTKLNKDTIYAESNSIYKIAPSRNLRRNQNFSLDIISQNLKTLLNKNDFNKILPTNNFGLFLNVDQETSDTIQKDTEINVLDFDASNRPRSFQTFTTSDHPNKQILFIVHPTRRSPNSGHQGSMQISLQNTPNQKNRNSDTKNSLNQSQTKSNQLTHIAKSTLVNGNKNPLFLDHIKKSISHIPYPPRNSRNNVISMTAKTSKLKSEHENINKKDQNNLIISDNNYESYPQYYDSASDEDEYAYDYSNEEPEKEQQDNYEKRNIIEQNNKSKKEDNAELNNNNQLEYYDDSKENEEINDNLVRENEQNNNVENLNHDLHILWDDSVQPKKYANSAEMINKKNERELITNNYRKTNKKPLQISTYYKTRPIEGKTNSDDISTERDSGEPSAIFIEDLSNDIRVANSKHFNSERKILNKKNTEVEEIHENTRPKYEIQDVNRNVPENLLEKLYDSNAEYEDYYLTPKSNDDEKYNKKYNLAKDPTKKTHVKLRIKKTKGRERDEKIKNYLNYAKEYNSDENEHMKKNNNGIQPIKIYRNANRFSENSNTARKFKGNRRKKEKRKPKKQESRLTKNLYNVLDYVNRFPMKQVQNKQVKNESQHLKKPKKKGRRIPNLILETFVEPIGPIPSDEIISDTDDEKEFLQYEKDLNYDDSADESNNHSKDKIVENERQTDDQELPVYYSEDEPSYFEDHHDNESNPEEEYEDREKEYEDNIKNIQNKNSNIDDTQAHAVSDYPTEEEPEDTFQANSENESSDNSIQNLEDNSENNQSKENPDENSQAEPEVTENDFPDDFEEQLNKVDDFPDYFYNEQQRRRKERKNAIASDFYDDYYPEEDEDYYQEQPKNIDSDGTQSITDSQQEGLNNKDNRHSYNKNGIDNGNIIKILNKLRKNNFDNEDYEEPAYNDDFYKEFYDEPETPDNDTSNKHRESESESEAINDNQYDLSEKDNEQDLIEEQNEDNATYQDEGNEPEINTEDNINDDKQNAFPRRDSYYTRNHPVNDYENETYETERPNTNDNDELRENDYNEYETLGRRKRPNRSESKSEDEYYDQDTDYDNSKSNLIYRFPQQKFRRKKPPLYSFITVNKVKVSPNKKDNTIKRFYSWSENTVQPKVYWSNRQDIYSSKIN